MILPDEAAHAADFGDAGHGIELIADKPILQRPQLAEVVAPLGSRRR